MAAILMMSAKLILQVFLKLSNFEIKRYDVIIYVYDVTNKILLRDSSYIVDMACDQCFVTLAFL